VTAEAPIDEDAGDPAVRFILTLGPQVSQVLLAVVDVREFYGRAVLGPGDRLLAVVPVADDERGVRDAVGDQLLLQCAVAVVALVAFLAVGVEPDAPAAAEDAVVSLDKCCEQVPGLLG